MKELNIENIVYYIENNSLTEFNNLVKNDFYFKNMIIYLYGDFKVKPLKFENIIRYTNSYQIKESDVEIVYENIFRINFLKLYPHIIVDLFYENEISFANDNVIKVYEFILKHEIQIKNKLNDMNKKIINMILNLMYIISFNSYTTYNCQFNNNWKVLRKVNQMYKKLMFSMGDELICYDVDVIYVKNINNKFIQQLDEFKLPYNIEDNINGVFFSFKKMILDENNKILIKSISERNNINEYKEKLLNIRRYNKLKNLYENK